MTDQTTPDPDDLLFNRLEVLLDDPALEEAMRLDEIQGYLSAVLSSPVPLAEEDWLIEILGDEEAVDSKVGREAAVLIRQFADRIVTLLAGDEPMVLLLYPKEGGDGQSDYFAWCQAYLIGVDQAPEDWFGVLEEDSEEADYLENRLFPMVLLAGEAEEMARARGETWPEGEEYAEIERGLAAELQQAVIDIYHFWRDTGASRHHRVKVGRNDPCPCGSGRKFKQCCGR